MARIEIIDDKFLWAGHFFVDDVALIFGKSGSGKSSILRQLLESNTKLNGFEKNFGDDAFKFYWFFSDAKLYRWIEKNILQPEFIKNWDELDDGGAEKMLNEKINKALVESGFGFHLKIKIVKYDDIKRLDKLAKGILIDYLVDGKKVAPNNLSNGQKLCAAILIHSFLLMGKGQIMLMDEPFNGIHHSMRKKILSWMKTLDKKFVIATHNIDLISQDTLLNVRYIEKVHGKGKIYNSFNFEDEAGISLFQQFGAIINKIGGEEEHEKWSPENVLMVEGVSEFIYFMKNPVLKEFLKNNELKIVIAGGKDGIIPMLDKLNGNSKKIYILWDDDKQPEWNAEFIKKLRIRENFNLENNVGTGIKWINTNEIDSKAVDIENLFFNKTIDSNEKRKAEFAFINATKIKSEITEAVTKNLNSKFFKTNK